MISPGDQARLDQVHRLALDLAGMIWRADRLEEDGRDVEADEIRDRVYSRISRLRSADDVVDLIAILLSMLASTMTASGDQIARVDLLIADVDAERRRLRRARRGMMTTTVAMIGITIWNLSLVIPQLFH